MGSGTAGVPRKSVLITGGAGFVGANIGLFLKGDRPNIKVTALDNLKRRGSELNLPHLRQGGVEFVHGDTRNWEDLELSANSTSSLSAPQSPLYWLVIKGHPIT